MDTESSQKKVGLDKHILSFVSSSSSLSALWLSWLSSWSSLSSLLYGLQPPHVLYLYVKAMYQPTKLCELFAYWWRQLMSLSYKRTLNTQSGGCMSRGNELWNELEENISLYCTMYLCDMILYMFSIPWRDSQPFLRARKPQLWHEESLIHKFTPLQYLS